MSRDNNSRDRRGESRAVEVRKCAGVKTHDERERATLGLRFLFFFFLTFLVSTDKPRKSCFLLQGIFT